MSTASFPIIPQCDGHHNKETLFPAAFKIDHKEKISEIMGQENAGLEIAWRALRESEMITNLEEGLLERAFTQRRIAISSAEKIELMGLRVKECRTLSILKAQEVEVGHLEPSV
uniref:Uncharacterized protein n=1 Tax=Cacopsylla melanoneura TaxID=428564 RepID=A0A8D8UDB0_9HEMI